MSLWKIDEQSSSMITQKFFDHLAKGHNKAQALSLAKADYLENAKGRTLAPVYWAGIVITGDNSPVEIKRKKWYGFRIWGVCFAFHHRCVYPGSNHLEKLTQNPPSISIMKYFTNLKSLNS